MGKSANYYNVDDFNKYKKAQGKCVPPRNNILAAACHIQALFDAKKFTYGFIGGLPMLCLGYRREMPDLHIAYDDKDFERLKNKLGSNYRVRLPLGMNPLLPFKILVWTGPEYKDSGCTINASIEIDLVPSGSCGTPPAGALTNNLVLFGLKTASGHQMVFKSLNIPYQMSTLLSYCKSRDLLWDPRKDILYLCRHEAHEVQGGRTKLNIKEAKELFLGTSFFSRLSSADQSLCYRVLLDTDPPPTMSITPPALPSSEQPRLTTEEPNQSTDTRHSRSRYRNGNGQRSNSSDRPADHNVQGASPQVAEGLNEGGQLSRIQNLQCVNSAKPQAVSAEVAAKRARNSMPNLLGAPQGTSSLNVIAPDTWKTSHRYNQRETPRHGSALLPPARNVPHHNRTKSELGYGSNFRPTQTKLADETANTHPPLPLQQKDSLNRADSPQRVETVTPVTGIQSQKGSLHVVKPEDEDVPQQQSIEDKSALLRGRLQLVGPEGVYGHAEQPQPDAAIGIQRQRNHSAPPLRLQPTAVFELDAAAPLPPQPTFIAELPAECVAHTPLTTHDRVQNTPHNQPPIKSANPRARSAPLESGSLPASLMIGGPGPHPHRQSLIHAISTQEEASTFSTQQTNAHRYSAYVDPQAVPIEASKQAPPETVTPVYKPYRPFVFTEELNRVDSVSSSYSPAHHKRDKSDDSTASHDSLKLAQEYQVLLRFEKGYGSD